MTDHNHEKASGKFHLVRHAAIRNEKGPPFEAGKIELIDPKGHVLFSAFYSAGGKGHGAPKFKDMRIDLNPAPANLKGINGTSLHVDEAIRLTDTHYLIHEDFGIKGFGCLHIEKKEVHKLCRLWDKIDDHQKSPIFHAVRDNNPGAHKQTVSIVESRLRWEHEQEVKAQERIAKAREQAKKVAANKTDHHEVHPLQFARRDTNTKIR